MDYYSEFISNLKKRDTPPIDPATGMPRLMAFLSGLKGNGGALPSAQLPRISAMPVMPEMPKTLAGTTKPRISAMPEMPKVPKAPKPYPFVGTIKGGA